MYTGNASRCYNIAAMDIPQTSYNPRLSLCKRIQFTHHVVFSVVSITSSLWDPCLDQNLDEQGARFSDLRYIPLGRVSIPTQGALLRCQKVWRMVRHVLVLGSYNGEWVRMLKLVHGSEMADS